MQERAELNLEMIKTIHQNSLIDSRMILSGYMENSLFMKNGKNAIADKKNIIAEEEEEYETEEEDAEW